MNSNALLAISLVLVLIASDARPAERTIPGEYEINIYKPPGSIIALKNGRHESREACKHAILFVKIKESGVRLRCDPVEQSRVR